MTTSTAHVTVVAVYNNLSAAHSAASELESNGFPIRNIYIHSGETPDLGDSVECEAKREYEEAFKSGNTILAVDTTAEEVERAGAVLNLYSPVNVHSEAGPASLETLAGTSIATRGSLSIPPTRRS